MSRSPVPHLSLPLPRCTVPAGAAELEEQAYRWALDRGLVDERGYRRLVASRIVLCGTGYFGDDPGPRAETISRWYVWLVLLDDFVDDELGPVAVDEHRAVLDTLLAELDAIFRGDPAEPSHPLTLAVAQDLWPGVSAGTTPAWRARFARDCRRMTESIWWHARVRSGQTGPVGEAVYLDRRRESIGAAIFCDMLEVLLGLSLDERFFDGPEYRGLVDAVFDTAGWVNDLWSAPKDAEAGEVNLVFLVAARGGTPWRDCLGDVAALIEARAGDFAALQAALPRALRDRGFDDHDVGQAVLFASRLALMIRACVDCHVISGRWAG
ncbi:hypothetical protein [Lentzea sp. NPDC060358]|uniref:terpene synthase family protein n=1 Tax=Lentzea sp. NPDC060358 TaxID=3347103 RepID=UPI00365F439D